MRWDGPKYGRQRADATPWESAVEAMIRSRRLAPTTAVNVRDNLIRGRLAGFRERHGIERVEDFGATQLRDFLDGLPRSADNPDGLAPATIRKLRQQLGWLGQWSEAELGLNPMTGTAMQHYRAPALVAALPDEEPLTQAEVARLLAAARPGRDRMLVTLLATTGMRPSELVALNVTDVRLDRRPPRIDVRRGSGETTKTPAGTRPVPLEVGGRSIVRDVRRYLESERHADTGSAALFLSDRRTRDGARDRLTQDALATMLERLSQRTGIHANAYRFRHSVCSWLADAGLPEHALMTLMGWADRTMVDRYYRRRPERVLALVSRIRF